MFDGNHRIRRQVNLGTKSRRRGRASTRTAAATSTTSGNSTTGFAVASDTGGGRESLLEQSRILREERRRRQLEETSATNIQKVFRSWKNRHFVAAPLLPENWQQQQQQQQQHRDTTTDDTGGFLARESFLLSLQLSPPLLHTLDKTADGRVNRVDTWLLEHATSILAHQQHQSPSKTPYAVSFRILQAALCRLRPLQQQQQQQSSASSSMIDEQFRAMFGIVEYYLSNTTTRENTFWKKLGGATGVLDLLKSTQECLWWYSNQPEQQQEQLQQQYAKSMQTLWRWACLAVQELQNSPFEQAGRALLAAIVMGHHTRVTDSSSPFRWWCHYGGTVMNLEVYEANFTALVQHSLLQTSNSCTKSTDNNKTDVALPHFSQTLKEILHGRWHIVLANALDWQQATVATAGLPSTALLQFLHHVITHHNDLAILTSMVAKGDDIRAMIILQQQQKEQQIPQAGDDDDVDDILDQEMNEQTATMEAADSAAPPDIMDSTSNAVTGTTSNTSSKKHKSSSSGKLTKQELQTMPQLERYYREGIERQRTQVISALTEQSQSSNPASKAYAQSLVEMAMQIGNPALWISWGDMLLQPQPTNNATATDGSATACQVYLQLLTYVLQSITGLRSRTGASSPFLSQLAFARGGKMIELLWLVVLAQTGSAGNGSSQDTASCTILTVFCDIFAHSLIAMSDENFISQYTTFNSTSTKEPPVLAEQVIGLLRNMLYEAYWTKPVVLSDVKLATSGNTSADALPEAALRIARARFLLSGTKLWGSLYERWCRLFRSTPFCDESTWWFPHLASQEGGGAVVNAAAPRGVANDLNGIADMDIDSESEDDEMERSRRGTFQTDGMTTAEAENDALASAFRDPKMARVLTCIPQALPFDRRVRLFDSLLSADKLKTQDENAEFRAAMVMMMRGEESLMDSGRERVEIRRDHLYDDSMRQLNRLGTKLKKKIQVSFVNQHGTQEAGIDGGGVFKEFVDDLIKDAFSIDTKDDKQEVSIMAPKLFSVTPLQTLTVNPSLPPDGGMLAHYEFLGRVLGKAVYESILVEPQFCLPFLNQLLGKRNSLEDLKNFDVEYYKNLTKLLSLNAVEIEGLGLSFEVTLGEGVAMRTVELLPGGRSKQVTKDNVIQYVHLVAHQRLNIVGSAQTKAFLTGFRDLIPASWVRLFSAYELQKLISGDDSLRGFDIGSLKRAMNYAAGYHPSQSVMQWFWEVLEEFTPEQQRKFLKFMTSCSRQPLLGFSSLDPPPCVQQVRLPDEMFVHNDMAFAARTAPLPTSSTCMNLLKLPNYRSKELMKRKILQAIESGAGFELT